MKKVKIIDTNFAHAKFTTDYQTSKHIEWDRNTTDIKSTDVVFFTDNSIFHRNSEGKKMGLLMEPRAVNPQIYEAVKNNHYSFEAIFTYDKDLLAVSDKFQFYPHGGCWIKPEDQMVYEKNKSVSIIASDKMMTNGHKLRHAVIKEFNGLDIFGRGYNPIDYKLEAFKDYQFSIVIENSKVDYYFTEKLIDSFMTGTVPIYWGCPSIGDFFNTDGMIIFDDMNDLLYELENLSLEKYKSMLPAIEENFEKAKKYMIAEDWIYENTNLFK